MIVCGIIWFGACIGNIVSPFFYKSDPAPTYHLGIGSLLVANFIEFLMFFVFRYAFIWENKKKDKVGQALRDSGIEDELKINATAFNGLTDREIPKFMYVY